MIRAPSFLVRMSFLALICASIGAATAVSRFGQAREARDFDSDDLTAAYLLDRTDTRELMKLARPGGANPPGIGSADHEKAIAIFKQRGKALLEWADYGGSKIMTGAPDTVVVDRTTIIVDQPSRTTLALAPGLVGKVDFVIKTGSHKKFSNFFELNPDNSYSRGVEEVDVDLVMSFANGSFTAQKVTVDCNGFVYRGHELFVYCGLASIKDKLTFFKRSAVTLVLKPIQF